MVKAHIEKLLKFSVYGSALLAFMLGATVAAGWLAGNPAIVQWGPDIVPMQFNTALTHMACAAALVLACQRGHKARYACIALAALIFLISFATGLQYLVGVSFGLDSLFVDALTQSQVKTAHPGRMAPNTVLCFILISIALMTWHLLKREEGRTNVAVLMGAVVLAFALTALIGYIFKIEAAYGWWSLSNIAPQTAVGFLFQGAGLVFFGLSQGRMVMPFRERWQMWRLPMLVAVGGIIITIGTAQAILEQGRERTETLAKAEGTKVAYIAELVMRNKLKALGRMAARWEMRGGTPLDEWARDASNFVKDNPSYDSMGLMDSALAMSRAVPERGGEYWRNVDFNREALTSASKQKVPYIARLSRDGSPQPVLAIFQPLFQNEEFYGFLVAAYNPGRELEEVLKADQSNIIQYEILDSEGLLASNFESESRFVWTVPYETEIQVRTMPFTVRTGLDARRHGNGGLVFIIFITGMCVSLLLANGMYKADDLRRIASRLRESEERYSQTVEGAEVALWDWDIEQGKIIWTGMAWHIFGVSSNDYVPTDEKEVRARIPAEDNEELNKIIAGDLERGDSFSVEFRIRQPSGKYMWVQSRGKAVERRRGQVLRAIGIFSDVTDRRNAEDQLRRTNDELEQFAYIASHDLKAPLRGIDNLAKWIIEDLSTVMTDDAREKMALLRGRVSRLEMLLEDILQYSRAGRIADDPIEIKTRDMIEQIVEDRSLPEGFKVEIPANMPVVVSSHTPLEQVFMNLISNACKHHDRTEGVIKIKSLDSGMFYEFAVIDDGPGIPPQFHERVFKMFQTLKPRDDKESSGLGLSIVKKLVEWQGGRVWVVSEPGQRGTAFHFLWPKKSVPVERKKNAA